MLKFVRLSISERISLLDPSKDLLFSLVANFYDKRAFPHYNR